MTQHYFFEAVDSTSGKSVTGDVTATSEPKAIELVRQKGLMVTKIKKLGAVAETTPKLKATDSQFISSEFEGYPWLGITVACYTFLALLCIVVAVCAFFVGILSLQQPGSTAALFLLAMVSALGLLFVAVVSMTIVDVAKLFARMEKHLRKIADR